MEQFRKHFTSIVRGMQHMPKGVKADSYLRIRTKRSVSVFNVVNGPEEIIPTIEEVAFPGPQSKGHCFTFQFIRHSRIIHENVIKYNT